LTENDPQATTDDQLLCALRKSEDRLHEWIHRSEGNARWFGRDPIAAMRAAELGIDPGLMNELESITTAIQGKLRRQQPPIFAASEITVEVDSAE
jgi:hypothetical protein